ncbi:hypothetical protein BC938DRAFT_475830 [Jimgerdemannia flammicorona]|uniref:Uncharacterized protein n=1 Tax=Jimgerdemannia flammicorona TaxID=994334 RepID=A0A433PNJ2_9FUNG|nr:hypothetical protein BC938DRAFT_475830 [Jimgerdemannia flammicorona]
MLCSLLARKPTSESLYSAKYTQATKPPQRIKPPQQSQSCARTRYINEEGGVNWGALQLRSTNLQPFPPPLSQTPIHLNAPSFARRSTPVVPGLVHFRRSGIARYHHITSSCVALNQCTKNKALVQPYTCSGGKWAKASKCSAPVASNFADASQIQLPFCEEPLPRRR